ncbi:MAG: VanZ family protein [Steroidobacteraceae bacterium]
MTESRFRHLWIAAIVVVVAVIAVASLAPLPALAIETGSDKFGHYIAYLVLALLASGIVAPERLWQAMLRCFLLGLGLEAAQAFLTDHRVAEWADLLANVAGILTAWLIAGSGRAGWGPRAAAWLIRGREP